MKGFIADCMLGRLAKWLRFMGYDVLYFREIEDRELVKIARAESRVILTRDRGIPERFRVEHYLIKAEDIESQLREVLKRFPPSAKLKSRCTECNTPIQEIQDREEVKDRVPEYVFLHHRRFWHCPQCGRLYWSGTHYRNMEERLSRICS